MALPILILIIVTSLIAFNRQDVFDNFALHPYSVARGKKTWTLITAGLIHADYNHLLFNCLSYYFFAFDFERTVGTPLFSILFLLGLVLSDVSTIYKFRDNYSYRSIGASGAISAIVFGYIFLHPWQKMYLFFVPIGIPAVIFGVGYLIYSFWASRNTNSHINHEAHFYGAITGLLVTALAYPNMIGYYGTMIMGGHM